MKRLLISITLIFLSLNVNAEISRNSIENIKQLSWSEIVDKFTDTYQSGFFAVNWDVGYPLNVLYFHPIEEIYGKLGKSGKGEYKDRLPAFVYESYSSRGQDGSNKSWSVNKQNNQICYGGKYSKHDCAYLFEGLEKNKKYFYFSLTKNGNFYSRINQVNKIDSWWVDEIKEMPFKFSQLNNTLTKIYNNKTRDSKEKEKEIFSALSTEDKRIAEEKIAKDAGYSSSIETKSAQKEADRKKVIEEKRIAEEKIAADRKRIDAKKAENLLDTYIDYLIIKNIYDGAKYYVNSSQMEQVKAITIATENYYKNSITSTDIVWQRAVNFYEREWAEYIATMKSTSYNTSFSGFTDLKMIGIINRASKNGISISNTVKDF